MIVAGLTLLQTYFLVGFVLGVGMSVLTFVLIKIVSD
jgi:uncharacterized membrane protein